jgi:regulator of sigma E protease
MSRAIRRNAGKVTLVSVRRDSATLALTVTPSVDFGVDIPEGGVRLPLLPAIATATSQTWVVTVKIVKFIERLITQTISPKFIAGPLGILQMTSMAAQHGMGTYLVLVATLSANLGFINLLPLAVLDGGLLVFLGFEAVTKRRPSAKQQGWIQRVGMAVLITLMVMVTIMDLQRMF